MSAKAHSDELRSQRKQFLIRQPVFKNNESPITQLKFGAIPPHLVEGALGNAKKLSESALPYRMEDPKLTPLPAPKQGEKKLIYRDQAVPQMNLAYRIVRAQYLWWYLAGIGCLIMALVWARRRNRLSREQY